MLVFTLMVTTLVRVFRVNWLPVTPVPLYEIVAPGNAFASSETLGLLLCKPLIDVIVNWVEPEPVGGTNIDGGLACVLRLGFEPKLPPILKLINPEGVMTLLGSFIWTNSE